MGKKGLLGEAVLKFWAFILLAVILLLFFGLFKLSVPASASITSSILETNSDLMLLSYLRTPVTIPSENGDENITFSDLIQRQFSSQGTPDYPFYNNLLKEKTYEIFGSRYPPLRWRLMVSDKRFRSADQPLFVAEGPSKPTFDPGTTFVDTFDIACTTIPDPAFGQPIKVQLVFANWAKPIAWDIFNLDKNREFHC